jgi:hypothetical protein
LIHDATHNRSGHDEEDDDEGDVIEDQGGDDGPADVSESLGDGFGKDSLEVVVSDLKGDAWSTSWTHQVEKDDRNLRRNDDGLVNELFNVEHLDHKGDPARVDGPDVSAHAAVDHLSDNERRRNEPSPGHQDHPVVPSDAVALHEPA